MKTGRIYVLKSNQTEKIYVGSTTKKLNVRFMNHKGHYKRYLKDNKNYISSFELIKYDDCYIELIKEVYCGKKQLRELENEEINKNSNCVNIIQAIRSIEKQKNYHVKYDQQEHIKQYHKDYCKTKEYKATLSILVPYECGVKISKSNMKRHQKSTKHLSSLV